MTTVINRRYILAEPLGKGGMGQVYRAFDRMTGHVVALKRVAAPLDQAAGGSGDMGSPESSAEELRLALAREFASLASLRHPNIIGVSDYGFDEQRQPYFTMEYLEDAKNIRDAGRDQPLALQVDLIAQMLRALAYIHRRGILHRDLKPGNVLVTRRGGAPVVKVLDFGLATEVAGARGMSGTMAYLAPEIITGEGEITFAADLYSIGIITYELFTGRSPYEGKTINSLIQHVLKAPIHIDINAVPAFMRPILTRLLAKRADERYADAEAVIQALAEHAGVPIPVDTAMTRESFLQASRMVGRDRELATLVEALERARTGTGAVWLIGGESGAGKTRLLDELATRALVSGALVLRGYVSESGGVPYQLWHDPLRRLVLGMRLNALELGVLKLVVPDIEALVDTPADARETAVELTGEAARHRLLAALIEVFKRQSQLIVLILEDLHWAFESLALLHDLAAARLPLLIVGSYRDDERPDLPEHFRDAHVIRLERLRADDIAALSESMLGKHGSKPELVELLERETEGNVFFLVETVRALAEEAGALVNVGRSHLPRAVLAGGVQAIVRRRLARVPSWGQPLLKLAAVAGRQFDLALLSWLASALDVDDLDAWVMATTNAAVGEIVEEKWRFAHDKLRQTALDDLPPDERRALHREVATAIETLYPDSQQHAEELFYHWREAGEMERELDYLFLAAERAINVTAIFPQALRWLESALTRYDTRLAEAQRGRLLNLMGRAYYLMSEHPLAKAQYEGALALGEAKIAAAARLGIADVELRLGELQLSITVAEQALAYYREVNDPRGIGDAQQLIGWVELERGDYRAARTLIEAALEIRQELNDQQGISLCYNLLGNAALYLGEYDTARSSYERSLALRTALGDVRGMSVSLNNLALVAQDLADYDAAWRYHEQSLEIKRRINDRHGIEISLSNLGYLAQLKGNLDLTEQLYQEALTLQRAIGDKRGMSTTLTDLGTVAMNKDDDDIAELYFEESRRLKREVEDRQGETILMLNEGIFLLVRGRYADARDHFLRGLALAREIGEPYLEGHCLTQLGELHVLEGAFADGLSRYGQALPIFREMPLPRETGLVLMNIARVNSLCGQHDEAGRALHDAAQIVQRLNVPSDKCRLLITAACMALDREEVERAMRWLGLIEAQRLTERSDRFLLARLQARLQEWLTPPPRAHHADSVARAALPNMDDEVARLCADS